MMVLVGVIYLAFEKRLLVKSKMRGDSTSPADNSISRGLIGAQVCKYLSYIDPVLTNLYRLDSLFLP